MASSPKVLFGFHAVGVRLKTTPASVIEVFFDPTRRDARMRQFQDRAKEAKVKLVEADGMRLAQLAGNHGHQGVVARVHAIDIAKSLDECLEALPEDTPALILVLDGITDPHNLGACLRVADGAGVHAVIAPKDHAPKWQPARLEDITADMVQPFFQSPWQVHAHPLRHLTDPST